MKKIIPIVLTSLCCLTNSCESGYVSLSNLLSWTKEINIENIEKVEITYCSSGGLPPGSLDKHYYSIDKNDILNACKMFNVRVKKQFISYCYGCSGSYSYSYFINNNEYQIGVNVFSDGYFIPIYDEEDEQYHDYIYSKLFNFPSIKNTQECYSIQNYGMKNSVYKIGEEKYPYKKISYLDEIEFIEATDEEMPNNEATYFLDGLSKDLLIYSPKIIKYGDTFYKIVSNKDFLDLFN